MLTNPYDILTTLAEVSITLAGFTGIVLLFSKPSGGWNGIDVTRFRILLTSSLSTVILSTIPFILLSIPMLQEPVVWRIMSLIFISFITVMLLIDLKHIKKHRHHIEKIDFLVILTLWPLLIIMISLQIINIFSAEAQFWKFLAGLLVNLIVSVVTFGRFAFMSVKMHVNE